jgi:hypothetical protein
VSPFASSRPTACRGGLALEDSEAHGPSRALRPTAGPAGSDKPANVSEDGPTRVDQLVAELRTEGPESWETPYGKAGHALIALGEESVPYVVPLLREEKRIAEKAAAVLAALGSRILPRLAELMRHEAGEMVLAGMLDFHVHVARSVTEQGDVVAKYLASPSVAVKRKAARFLRDTRPEGRDLLEAIRGGTKDPDDLTRHYCEKSLQAPGE